MRVVLGAVFKRGRAKARRYYAATSEPLAEKFDKAVKEVIRTIAQRNGGDHVGTHGYPCRRCSPFPYLVYYRITGDSLRILGVIHEGRHPDFLRRELEDRPD